MKTTLPLLVLLLGAPAFAVPLSVSVIDAQSAPVAGAEVQLESLTTPSTFVSRRTGADGRATFDIDAPKPSIYGDFIGRLAVYRNGFALGTGALNFNKPAQVALVRVGRPISGLVVDAKQKPVAGAKVSLILWRKGRAFPTFIAGGPLQAHLQTTTDARGRWTLDVLPPGVTATTSTLAPGNARQRTEIEVGGVAKTVLHAGARVQGRLLGLDEKPLAGVHVFAQPDQHSAAPLGYGEDTTGVNGAFDLDGLEAGTYNVMFQVGENSPFVIAAFEGIQAKAGAPIRLADARAVQGVLIGGKVTERGTDKGIAGAQIGVYGAANPSSSAAVSLAAPTDENGVWTKRTLPGQSQVYLYGVPREFKREDGQKMLQIPVAGQSGLNFVLTRAAKITGRVLDENGRGVRTSSLTFRQGNDEFPLQIEESGDFVAFGPAQGEIEVARSRWNSNDDRAQWDVVGTGKFSIPSSGPLTIRLKRAELSSLEVGVFDQNDAAVEGARVVVMLSTRHGDTEEMEPHELKSDKTGRAHLDGIRADEKISIESASKAGFAAAPLPAVTKLNGVYHADITLAKRAGTTRSTPNRP